MFIGGIYINWFCQFAPRLDMISTNIGTQKLCIKVINKNEKQTYVLEHSGKN